MGKHTPLKMAAVATGALAILAIGTGAAQALPAPNGSAQQLALVGSDTTFSFMGTYAKAYNASTSANPDHDVLVNIAAKPTANQTIKAEGTCTTARTYGPSHLPPDGSGAGRKALYGTDGLAENANNPKTACLDIARSSGARDAAVDPSTARFYGFAKDAVSYAYFGTGPKNLTQADLKAIYSCSKTSWSQVSGSGKSGTILRYLPQAGSGTRDFFLKTVLGGSTVAPSSSACPLVETIQENTGTAIPSANRARAIVPYSVGQWVAQNHASGTDKSAGSFIGALNGVAAVSGDGTSSKPNTTAILNSSFLGSRMLYNVLDTRLPSFGQALRAVGVDNSGASPLCNGAAAASLRTAGFVPLPSGATGGGVTRASTCRLS